jgi:hypothetical protein
MNKFASLLLASVMLVLLLETSASASCAQLGRRLLCAEYFQSDAVVTAKVLKIRHVTVSDDDDYLLYTMQTERVLRGKMPAIFKIVDSPYTHRALVGKRGQRYLLFLSYQKNYKAWAVDECGNSGPLEESTETLKGVDQLKLGGTGGTVQGNVWQWDGNVSVSTSGATVLVKGKQRTFKATTNKDGNFEMHVPAGVYSATVTHDGKQRFEPGIWSYEDPRRFRVSNGGCAQVQFDPIEPK